MFGLLHEMHVTDFQYFYSNNMVTFKDTIKKSLKFKMDWPKFIVRQIHYTN
jgi:hypothetical protein